jgi:hypothetical protein
MSSKGMGSNRSSPILYNDCAKKTKRNTEKFFINLVMILFLSLHTFHFPPSFFLFISYLSRCLFVIHSFFIYLLSSSLLRVLLTLSKCESTLHWAAHNPASSPGRDSTRM